MKLEQGDLFEQTHAVWIRTHLPSYEDIWSAFIGHDGKGQPLPMPSLPEQKQIKRKLFCQAHYSFAVSARLLTSLVEQSRAEAPGHKGLDALMHHYQLLFLTMAYVGHIRDMFVKMYTALDIDLPPHGGFQEFYQQRSTVLHGPRPAMAFDDVSWIIPVVAGETEQPGEWHSRADWGSADLTKGMYVTDFIDKTHRSLFELITSEHPKIFPAADKYFERTRVSRVNFQFPMLPESAMVGLTEPPVPSGIVITPEAAQASGAGYLSVTAPEANFLPQPHGLRKSKRPRH